jgi:hypothetical protein
VSFDYLDRHPPHFVSGRDDERGCNSLKATSAQRDYVLRRSPFIQQQESFLRCCVSLVGVNGDAYPIVGFKVSKFDSFGLKSDSNIFFL